MNMKKQKQNTVCRNQKSATGSRRTAVSRSLLAAALAVSAGSLPSSALAQTNAPAGQDSFFQSLGGYLTGINTNYSFAANTFEVSLGAGQSGPVLANYVAAQYDLRANATLARWDLAAQVRNAGVAGVIQSAEVGGGYTVIQAGDTKVQAGALAGYDWNKAAALFEPQLVLRKKATKNTFFEIGVSLPEWTSGPLNKTPAFFAGTGFTY